MKINPNYKLREIAGEMIIVNQGKAGVDITRVISLNKSAQLLYKSLEGKDFTLQDAANILIDKYGISGELATKDASYWIERLSSCGIIE